VRLLAALALALTPLAVLADWRNEPVYAQFSAPLSAGEPIEGSATIRVTFDEANIRRKCEVIVSSGDAAADKHACVTVPTYGAKGVIEGAAKVWKVPNFTGVYRGPIAKTMPGRWSIVDDIPSRAYGESRSGTVIMRVEIDAAGTVTRCDIFLPSRSATVNKAVADKFCERVRFQPATLDGNPTPARLLMAIRYAQSLG
jgi:TonB family protein